MVSAMSPSCRIFSPVHSFTLLAEVSLRRTTAGSRYSSKGRSGSLKAIAWQSSAYLRQQGCQQQARGRFKLSNFHAGMHLSGRCCNLNAAWSSARTFLNRSGRYLDGADGTNHLELIISSDCWWCRCSDQSFSGQRHNGRYLPFCILAAFTAPRCNMTCSHIRRPSPLPLPSPHTYRHAQTLEREACLIRLGGKMMVHYEIWEYC